MIKKSLHFILIFSLFSCTLHAQEEQPFWRRKNKLFQQITGKRRVVVAVKREGKKELEKFRLVGVGAVHAPLSFATEIVGDFEKLKDISGHFKDVQHRPKKKQVYIVLEALGYQARLLLEYKWQKKASEKAQLDWQVVWGPLKGMVGHFQFQTLEAKKTEVSIWTVFSGERIPLPAFFLRITLEVIAEKVAQKMRSYIEREYNLKQQKLQSKGKAS